MTYFEKVTNTYRDSMMAMGVSEDVINFCLFSFETGFRAGKLYDGDITFQKEMIATLLNENNIN